METETITINAKQRLFQNRQNLEHIIKKIKVLKTEIEKEGSFYGITDKVMKKIFNNEEVIVCYNCKTPNMYKTNHNICPDSKVYQCDKCKATFIEKTN